MVQLELHAEPKVHLLPVSSKAHLSQPHFLTGVAHARELHRLAGKSAPELTTAITEGVVPLTVPVASSPKIAMMCK
jgi:hypothetical protein